uniref:Condensin complex subunit 1 C-terminal domain-containing protein n=1 Tax=Panagrolaimus superbus TaxID=310955 RepID=A0A914YAV8_9BILA
MNIGAFKRETKSEALSAGTVTRKRLKPEWKEEPKHEVTSVNAVIEELCKSIIENDITKFHVTLSRFNSVYIYRLRKTEAADTIKALTDAIANGTTFLQNGQYGDDLIYLLKTIFESYNVPDFVAESTFYLLNDKADNFYVTGSLFSLGEALLNLNKIKPAVCYKASEFAKQCLVKYNDNSRVLAIQFLISFLHKANDDVNKNDLCLFILEYCYDRNSKIRRFAVEGIEKYFRHEKRAPFHSYVRFTKSCQDTDKFVRLSSLRIVRMFADFFPNEIVKEDRRFPLRLGDDAFTTVCHAMNDLDVDIRSEAAKLLGTFDDVAESFLFQTLDKKLMKNMKRLSDGRVASGASSEWSTGKKLGEDMPIEGNEEEGQSMIPTGACGAFVTALEDEFKAVRQPAVYSLGKLATKRPVFANACIDHLADMFNDEIAAVRIDAIRALTPLVNFGVLQSEQLKTLLTGLDDASQDSRIALLELLSRSNFIQTDCIKDLLSRLISSLHRFPRDQHFIFKCVSSIGARHSHLLADIVAEVYRLHPFLARVEESINDQFYLVKLILILNGAAKSDSICSLLPDYVKMNYRFVRLTMPDLVPCIKAFDHKLSSSNEMKPLIIPSHSVNKIIGKEFSRLLNIQQTEDIIYRQKLYQKFLEDIKFFLKVEAEYAYSSNFLHALATVLFLMDKIMNSVKNDTLPSFLDIQETLEKIYFIEHECNGIPKDILIFLLECSTNLNVIYAGIRTLVDAKGFSAISMLNDELRRVQKKLIELDAEPTQQLGNLLRFLIDPTKISDGPIILKSVAKNNMVINDKVICEFDKITIKSVKIVEPTEVKKFTMMIGLPTGVPVICILSNFTPEDIPKFRIKVKYPDDTSAYFLPPRSDFCQISDTQWSLHTHVLVVVREGIAAVTMAQFTFGIFFPRVQCSSVHFYDRCFGFIPSSSTSANTNGQFLALPDTDDLLKKASICVKTEPMQLKKVS